MFPFCISVYDLNRIAEQASNLAKILKRKECMKWILFLEGQIQRRSLIQRCQHYGQPKYNGTDKYPLLNRVHCPKDLPIIINGATIRAQPDTGAESGNFISQDLASKLELCIQKGTGCCQRFMMGNGKIVQSIGRVQTSCAFERETQTIFACWFEVFETLARPLIMGSQFLRETQTMSRFTKRLEDRSPKLDGAPMISLIGSTYRSKRLLAAPLDGRDTFVNADSGSELDPCHRPTLESTFTGLIAEQNVVRLFDLLTRRPQKRLGRSKPILP